MNAIAAAPGWRSVAIWVMPPVAYALASDTLIGVVRAWAIARQKALNERLADDEATPLAVVGGLLLWLLRLALAPASTLAGFRPGWSRSARSPRPPRSPPAAGPGDHRRRDGRGGRRVPAGTTRRAGRRLPRFLALVTERHGPLATVPVADVSRICAELAPQAGLNTGAARTALRQAVLAARDWSSASEGRRSSSRSLLVLAGLVRWALVPGRQLPGNRVRYLRLRLHLRLHPGRGYRHGVRAVAAVGPVRGVPQVRPRSAGP